MACRARGSTTYRQRNLQRRDLRRRIRKVRAFTTTTGTFSIRVIEFEAMAHHAADKIQLESSEVHEALGVNDNASAKRGELFVGGPHFIRPFKNVRKPSATTTAHTNPNPRFGRAALEPLLDDFLRCVFGNLNNFLPPSATTADAAGVEDVAG